MKKLYFLDEEEKNRILNLHESATKNQYLNEADEYRNISFQEYRDSGKIPKGEEKYYQGSGIKRVKTSEFPIKPVAATGGELDKAIADPAKKADRIKNISKIVCSLKGDTITSKGSQFNGKSWVDYVTRFKITSAEEAQAKKLCSTGGDARLYNIAKIVCSVDATGKIVNANSKLNGTMFTDYVTTYKLSGAEVAKAKTLCGKLGIKPAANVADVGKINSPANVDVKSKVSAAEITPKIQAVQKQLGIQNGTGTLDAATLQAMLTKLDGVLTPPSPAAGTQVQQVSSLTPVGNTQVSNTQSQLGVTSDQLNNTIKQFQANANRPI